MKKTLLIILMLLALALTMGAGLRAPEEGYPPEAPADGYILDGYGTELSEPYIEPEELGPYVPPITTGPGNDALYEKAAAYTGHESLAARLGDPEHYESEFASTDGSMTVTVDAKVTVPDAAAAPLIRVTSTAITQEQADTLMDALVHCTLYPAGGLSTKAELAQAIAEAEQDLENMTILDDPIGPDTDETYRDAIESRLAKLRAAYETAPDTPQPISGQFEPEFDGDDLVIEGQGESGEYGTEYLQVRVTDWLGGSWAVYERNGFDTESLHSGAAWELANGGAPVPETTCTEAEARALCDAVVEKLGVDGMSLYSARKAYTLPYTDAGFDRRCWTLQYTRCLDGLPITYTAEDCQTLTDQRVYLVPWQYETMTFYVDDSGIVGFRWASPYELGEHVTEDAALLPFDDAMAVFEKMFVVAYDNDSLSFAVQVHARLSRSSGTDFHVDVTDIRLGYDRIAEMDKEGTGLLVPVWDFFGTVTDGDGNVLSDDPDISLLTVNAVDGDVIDRGFGY